MFDFKVGQKYKTRNVKIANITGLLDATQFFYPVQGECNGDDLHWTVNGRNFNPYSPSPYDLIELVEDTQTVEGNEMKHKNHEFITAFINGESVQYMFASGDWMDVKNLRELDYEVPYRMKPKTKNINGFEVPMPMDKEPEKHSTYYYPELTNPALFMYNRYATDWDKKNFDRGICFLTRKDAVATAKAMLGIDPNT